MSATVLKPLSEPIVPSLRTTLLAGAAALVLLSGAVGAFLAGSAAVEQRRVEAEEAWNGRLAAEAAGKATALATPIKAALAAAKRLAGSDVLRLYVTERLIEAHGGAGYGDSLDNEEPYLRRVLDDLASREDLRAVRVIDRRGEIVLRDQISPSLPGQALIAAGRAIDTVGEGGLLAPVRRGDHMVVDLLVPVRAVQSVADEPEKVGAVLIEVDLGALGRASLGRGVAEHPAETTGLEVADGTVYRLDGSALVGDAAADPEDPRVARAAVDGTGWSIRQTVPGAIVTANARAFAQVLTLTGGAALFAMLASLGLLLTRSRLRRHEVVLAETRALNQELAEQRDLLARVTDGVAEWIYLSRPDGTIAFANEPLRRALGRSRLSLPAQAGALFGVDAAQLLRRDAEVRSSGIGRNDRETASIDGVERQLSVSRTLLGRDGGVIVVARDVTEATAQAQRQERLQRQTVDALVRAVELADPYLLGHTARVRALCALLADQLGLVAQDRLALDLAAALSQIGKIFLPRHLLRKTGRFDAAETEAVQRHIDHALRVLTPIPFELPVAAIVGDLHERLDGTGYPEGKRGELIHPLARILAVADVFVARTAPRAYRDAIAPTEALQRLEENLHRYDPAAVRALGDLVRGGQIAAELAEPPGEEALP